MLRCSAASNVVGLVVGSQEQMPKVARALSASQVKRLMSPGLHPVGGVPGLALQVSPTGARSWILLVTVAAKRRDMGLGQFPGETLAQARDKGRRAREQIELGHDPIVERERAQQELNTAQANAISFKAAAQAYIDVKSAEWVNSKHTGQWARTLQTYAFPVGRARNSVSAASDSGTRCRLLAFMRSARMVHSFESRSISDQAAPRATRGRK